MKSSPKIKLDWFPVHICRPHCSSSLVGFQRTKGNTTVQWNDAHNLKAVEMSPLFCHHCGLEGHAIAELVTRFSRSDKSKVSVTFIVLMGFKVALQSITTQLSMHGMASPSLKRKIAEQTASVASSWSLLVWWPL